MHHVLGASGNYSMPYIMAACTAGNNVIGGQLRVAVAILAMLFSSSVIWPNITVRLDRDGQHFSAFGQHLEPVVLPLGEREAI